MKNGHAFRCFLADMTGGRFQIDGNFVQYRNALIYKEQGAGPIVREHRWRVDLQCNFRRQMQVREWVDGLVHG